MERRTLLLTLAALLAAPLLLGKAGLPWRLGADPAPQLSPPGRSVKRRG